MHRRSCVGLVLAFLALGGTASAQGEAKKATAIKVVVLIDARTRDIPEGAKVRQIETTTKDPAGKDTLHDVKEKGSGKAVKRLDGIYVLRAARITLADGRAIDCEVLIAVDVGRTTLRDVHFVSTLEAYSGNRVGTWHGYTAVTELRE